MINGVSDTRERVGEGAGSRGIFKVKGKFNGDSLFFVCALEECVLIAFPGVWTALDCVMNRPLSVDIRR